MALKRVIITKADHERMNDLFLSSFVDAIRDKPYLSHLRREFDVANVVEPTEVPSDVITINSTVRLRDMKTKETETFTLVYPNEAKIAEGKLSVLSPLGAEIFGRRVGESLTLRILKNETRKRIEKMSFQPERSGAFDM